MAFNRLDEFVSSTSFLWFLVLIMTFGFLKWLLLWFCYELVISVFIDEKPKKLKKKKKKSEPEDEVKDKKYI